jgi:hypothetical protein
MRRLTSHIVNPANDRIKITVMDAPGPGGANHLYALHIDDAPNLGKIAYDGYFARCGGKSLISGAPLPAWADQKTEIQEAWHAAGAEILEFTKRNPLLSFQNGPIAVDGNGVNGITHEALIAVLMDRLRAFQAGPYANNYNYEALVALAHAQERLQARTKERMARGVEGTHAK